MKNINKSKKLVLIMIRGLPGSGKSYLASELQKRLGANVVTLIDPDALDKTSKEYIDFISELKKQGVEQKLYPYRFLRFKAYQAISNQKIVVWNQAFSNSDLLNKTIVNLQNFATEQNIDLTPLIVEVEVDHKVAKERVVNRELQGGHGVPNDTFEKFVNDYTSFKNEDYILVNVSGEENVEISVYKVISKIEKLI